MKKEGQSIDSLSHLRQDETEEVAGRDGLTLLVVASSH